MTYHDDNWDDACHECGCMKCGCRKVTFRGVPLVPAGAAVVTGHPALYKKSSTGAIQVWKVWTEDNTIVTEWGQFGGAMQTTRDVVAKGKNVGKKNETSPTQQAGAEAQSQWEKKLKKGYVQHIEDAKDGRVDEVIEGGISPMLAHRFDEQGHKLLYPCYVQPKLDGHRCIAVVGADGVVTLWSRTRKPITSMSHIADAVRELGLPIGTVLDGELYHHDYRDMFETLTSFIRDTKAKPGAEVVQYHVYDIATDAPYAERLAALRQIIGIGDGPLVPVETGSATDEDELLLLFERHLAAGYEGAMARNAHGAYVTKRSYDLLKIKEFIDAEFEVVGVEEGRGKLAGHAIFVCKAENGNEFRAKMKGETENLKQYWNDPSLAVGRQLTVKYFGITNKNGLPRFPVALRFKEDV